MVATRINELHQMTKEIQYQKVNKQVVSKEELKLIVLNFLCGVKNMMQLRNLGGVKRLIAFYSQFVSISPTNKFKNESNDICAEVPNYSNYLKKSNDR